MSTFSESSEPVGVFPANSGETASYAGGVYPSKRHENGALEPCGAKTRNGGRCGELVRAGRRCRLHGGASTGPRTVEGRRRIGDAARARYVRAALAEGWVFPTDELRAWVRRLKAAFDGSQNATARALGITWHGVRRVLVGLPVRRDESETLERRFPGAAHASVDSKSCSPTPSKS